MGFEHGLIIVGVAYLIGFLMAWGVGANDLANIMSTTMGSRAMTVRQAIIIAIIFEFAGAFLGGIHVTNTIRTGIINIDLFQNTPIILVYGMLATLLAGMTWMFLASFLGMPVSITHAVIGALVGFGVVVLGVHAVHWHIITLIALTWILSPLFAGVVSYFLFSMIRFFIMGAGDPYGQAKRVMPFLLLLVGIVFALMIVLKDIKNLGYILNIWERLGITVMVSMMTAFLGMRFAHRRMRNHIHPEKRFEYVEHLFSILMALTACAMIFAHGSNDIAIAVGPIAAVSSLVKYHGNFAMMHQFPKWIMLMACLSVVGGLVVYGHKVIATVGRHITELTPSRAFCATIAAAMTVIVSTSAGIPVSATQTLVGGVLGVGLARGIGALNIRVVRNIFLSWVITVPSSGILAIGYFELIKRVLILYGVGF